MAVYGIGAMYDGTNDQTEIFIKMGVACVGWSPNDAPTIHAQMKSVKAGGIFLSSPMRPLPACTSRPSAL